MTRLAQHFHLLQGKGAPKTGDPSASLPSVEALPDLAPRPEQDSLFGPLTSTASEVHQKKEVSKETIVFLVLFFGLFGGIGHRMGLTNMLNTMMNTAFALLTDTVFYIMAIAVLSGAISALFAEFGVVAMLNVVLAYLMKPLYNLPGASSLGILTCYLSDNPAILTLSSDKNFKRYFKRFQIPALTNLGTAFGMGLIVSTFMLGIVSPSHENFALPVLLGNVGAMIGSIVSVRLMLHFTKREFGTEQDAVPGSFSADHSRAHMRDIRDGNTMTRFLDAMLSGGKSGVDMGLAIVPGVLIICTLVMMLTKGPGTGGTYSGAAFEGVALLPLLGQKIEFLLAPLFGLTSPEGIAVPITALGAAGAAIGLVPKLVKEGLAAGNDIAVFTAMCMCWSGYLSTHVAMMHSLGCSKLTGKAIFSHTIGGLCAGISAHWLFVLLS